MTVINAVALAGGSTYRADQDGVSIARAGKECSAALSARLLPDDVVRVGERFF